MPNDFQFLKDKYNRLNLTPEDLAAFNINPPGTTSQKKAKIKIVPQSGIESLDYSPETSVILPDRGQRSFDRFGVTPSPTDLAYSKDLRALNQHWSEKWANGITSAAINTGTVVLGGTVGTLYGLPNLLTGNFQGFYDNKFQQIMDNINDWASDAFPNYYTRAEQEYNLGKSLGTANFWADQFMQGISFTIGAVLAELTASAATAATLGGAAPAQAAQTLNLMARAKEIIKAYKAVNTATTARTAFTLARQLGTGAAFEAGVEARHYKKETTDKFLQQFQAEKKRMPNEQEMSAFMDDLNKASNAIFTANTALVGISNILMFPKVFGAKLPTSVTKKLGLGTITPRLTGETGRQALMGGAGERAAYKEWAAKWIGTPFYTLYRPAYEGFMEEGNQSVLSHTGSKYVMSRHSPYGVANALSTIEALGEGFAETYSSKEGWKEVFIGALIGAIGAPGLSGAPGIVQGYREGQTKRNAYNKQRDLLNSEAAQWSNIRNAIQGHAASVSAARVLEEQKEGQPAPERTTSPVLEGYVDPNTKQRNYYEDPFMRSTVDAAAVYGYLETRHKTGLLGQTHEEFNAYMDAMSDNEFQSEFGYTNLSAEEIKAEKARLKESFDKSVKSFQEAKLATEDIYLSVEDESRGVRDALAYDLYKIQMVDSDSDQIVKDLSEILGGTPVNMFRKYLQILGAIGGHTKASNNNTRAMKLLKSEMDAIEKEYRDLIKFDTIEEERAEKLADRPDKLKEREEKEKSIKTKIKELKSKLSTLNELPEYNFDLSGFDEFYKSLNEFIKAKDAFLEAKKQPAISAQVNKLVDRLAKNETLRRDAIFDYNFIMTKEGQKYMKDLEDAAVVKLLEELPYLEEFTLHENQVRMLTGEYAALIKSRMSPEAKQMLEEDKTTEEGKDTQEEEDVEDLDQQLIGGHSTITQILTKYNKNWDKIKSWIETWHKNNLKKDILSTSIVLQKVDYKPIPDSPLAGDKTGRFYVHSGLTQDKNKAIDVYIDLNNLGDVVVPEEISKLADKNGRLLLGHLLDPRRFKDKGEFMDLSDPEQAALLNSDLVDTKGRWTHLGRIFAKQYIEYVKFFKENIDNQDEIDTDTVRNFFKVRWNPYFELIEKPTKNILDHFKPEVHGVTPTTNKGKTKLDKGIYIVDKDFRRGFVITTEGTARLDDAEMNILENWMKVRDQDPSGIQSERKLLDIHKDKSTSQYSAIIDFHGQPMIIDVGHPSTKKGLSITSTELGTELGAAFKGAIQEVEAQKEALNEQEHVTQVLTLNGSPIDVQSKFLRKAFGSPYTMTFEVVSKSDGYEVPGGAIRLTIRWHDNGKPQYYKKWLDNFYYDKEENTLYYYNGSLYKEGLSGQKEIYDHKEELFSDLIAKKKVKNPDAAKLTEVTDLTEFEKAINYTLNELAIYGIEPAALQESERGSKNKGRYTYVLNIDKKNEPFYDRPDLFIVNSQVMDDSISLVAREVNDLPEVKPKKKNKAKKPTKGKNSSNRNTGKGEKTRNKRDFSKIAQEVYKAYKDWKDKPASKIRWSNLQAFINDYETLVEYDEDAAKAFDAALAKYEGSPSIKQIKKELAKKFSDNKKEKKAKKEKEVPESGLNAEDEAKLAELFKTYTKFRDLWADETDLEIAEDLIKKGSFTDIDGNKITRWDKFVEDRIKRAQVDNSIKGNHSVLSLRSRDEKLTTEDYNKAVEALKKILPIGNGITVREVDQIIKNLREKDIPVGMVVDATNILLARERTPKTKFHEAFHVIFRAFLSDEQISDLITLAEERFGVPTEAQMEAFRTKMLEYGIKAKGLDLVELWYEEQLAEDFSDHMESNRSWLGRIWNALKRMVRAWFKKSNELYDFYSNIRLGKYREAKPLYPIRSRHKGEAFKLLEINKFDPITGQTINKVLNHKLSRTLLNELSYLVISKGLDSETGQPTQTQIEEAINTLQEKYSIKNFADIIKNPGLESFRRSQMIDELDDLQEALHDESVIQELGKLTRFRAKIYNLDITNPDDVQEVLDRFEDEADTETWRKEMTEIGGYMNLSKRMREFMALSQAGVDLFNTGLIKEYTSEGGVIDDRFMTSINAYEVYSGITRALANHNKRNIYKVLKEYSKYNIQSEAFYNKMLDQIFNEVNESIRIKNVSREERGRELLENYSREQIEEFVTQGKYHLVKESSLHNAFIANFYEIKAYYYFVRIDPQGYQNGREKVVLSTFNSNNRDVDKQQFDRWAKDFSTNVVREKMTRTDYHNIIGDISIAYHKKDGFDGDWNSRVDFIQEQFKRIGVSLTRGYIEYSLTSYYKDTEGKKWFKGLDIGKELRKSLEETYEAFKEVAEPIHRETNKEKLTDKSIDELESIKKSDTNANTFFILQMTNSKSNLRTSVESDEEGNIFGNYAKEAKIVDEELAALSKAERLELKEKKGAELKVDAQSTYLFLARNNAIFDETIGDSTFRNAEDKTIYDHLKPNFLNEVVNILNRNAIDFTEITDWKQLQRLMAKEGYPMEDFFAKKLWLSYKHNPLLKDIGITKAYQLLRNLKVGFHDGLAERKYYEGRWINFKSKKGQSYKKLDQREAELYSMSLYRNPGPTGIANDDYAFYHLGVLEAKSLATSLLMPVQNFYERGKLTRLAKVYIKSSLQSEYERIQQVVDEERNRDEWYSKKYHGDSESGYRGNGTKLFMWAGLPQAADIENLAMAKNKVDFDDIKKHGIDLDLIIDQFAEQEFQAYLNHLGKIGLIQKEIKSKKVGNKIVEQEGGWVSQYLPQAEPLENKTLPGFVDSKNNVIEENLAEYFWNDYLNTMAANMLIHGDFSMNYKFKNGKPDFTDVVKRNGGLMAAGPATSSGTETVKIAAVESIKELVTVYNEQKKGPTEEEVDSTDGQSFATVGFMRKNYMRGLGKSTRLVDTILKKIERGIPMNRQRQFTEQELEDIAKNPELLNEIKKQRAKDSPGYNMTEKERNHFLITDKDVKELTDNNATLQPKKTVLRTFFDYHKTSTHTLNRSEFSNIHKKKSESWKDTIKRVNDTWDDMEDIMDMLEDAKINNDQELIVSLELELLAAKEKVKSLYYAKKGAKKMHNLLNQMLDQDIDLLVFDSAIKTAKFKVNKLRNDEENPWGQLQTQFVSAHAFRDQVNTDGFKTSVVDGTQKIQLVESEQDDTTEVIIDGVKTNIGHVRKAHKKYLVDRINLASEILQKSIFNFKRGKISSANYEHILRNFQDNIKQTGADPYIMTLFTDTVEGQPVYKLDFPAIRTKFMQMYLAYISKSLSHKAPGRKYTLVSDWAYTKRDGTRLKFGLEKDGMYYSEVIVSEKTLSEYGLKMGDVIPEDVAFQMGVRIPTQDKHSMVVMKIVGVTESYMGNMVVLPKEVITLSGADFDIDSLYARVFAVYGKGSNKKLYGSYLKSGAPIQDAYEEYKEHLTDKDPRVNKRYEELKKDADSSINKKLNRAVIKVLNEHAEHFSNDINENTLARFSTWKQFVETYSTSIEDEAELEEDELLFKDELDFFMDFIRTELGYKASKIAESKLRTDLKKAKRSVIKPALANLKQAAIEEIGLSFEAFKELKGDQVKNNVDAYKKGEFDKIDPLSINEANNLMLRADMALSYNKGNKNIAETPAKMTYFEEKDKDGKVVGGVLGFWEKLGIPRVADTTGLFGRHNKLIAREANRMGKDNIGPVALYNIIFRYLEELGLTSIAGDFMITTKLRESDENSIRSNDFVDQTVSSQTDASKEMHPVEMNLTVDSLTPALVGATTGKSIYYTMNVLKSKYVKKIIDLEGIRPDSIFYEWVGSPKQMIETFEFEVLNELGVKKGDLPEIILNENLLEQMLLREHGLDNNLTDEEYAAIVIAAMNDYAVWSAVGKDLSEARKIIALIKGLASDWREVDVRRALDRIGIEIKGDLNSPQGIYFEQRMKDGLPDNNSGINFQLLFEDPFLKRQAQESIFLEKHSELFFTEQTEKFKDIIDKTIQNFKPGFLQYADNYDHMVKSLLSYLSIHSFRHLRQLQGNPVKFDPEKILFTDHIEKLSQELRRMKDSTGRNIYGDNFFLRHLMTHNTNFIDFYYGIDKNEYTGIFYNIETDNWSRKNQDYNDAMMHGYSQLLRTGIEKGKDSTEFRFIKAIQEYLFLRDGLQFKNNSYITQITPESFKEAHEALEGVHNMLTTKKSFYFNGKKHKAKTFFDLFGRSEEEVMHEFAELYSRNTNQKPRLRGAYTKTLIQIFGQERKAREKAQKEKGSEVKLKNKKQTKRPIENVGFLDTSTMTLTINLSKSTDLLKTINALTNTGLVDTITEGEKKNRMSFPYVVKLDHQGKDHLMKLAYGEYFAERNKYKYKYVIDYANGEWFKYILTKAGEREQAKGKFFDTNEITDPDIAEILKDADYTNVRYERVEEAGTKQWSPIALTAKEINEFIDNQIENAEEVVDDPIIDTISEEELALANQQGSSLGAWIREDAANAKRAQKKKEKAKKKKTKSKDTDNKKVENAINEHDIGKIREKFKKLNIKNKFGSEEGNFLTGQDVETLLKRGEIQLIDEETGKPCAKYGMRTKFRKGGKWSIVKDLKGFPTHTKGGVDINISKSGVSINAGGDSSLMAEHGLIIPKEGI